MASLKPFKALRPFPNFAAQVASVPYDVINTLEAREMAAGKPNSFLHVIRPEIDLEPGIDVHDDHVYEKGASNLNSLKSSGAYLIEEKASLYIYRIIMDGRAQTGIFGCVSVEDYDNNVILKHELTRPDKEDDRTRHILTQEAHAEPVMLTFKDSVEVTAIIEHGVKKEPLFDFISEDAVQHTLWKIEDTSSLISEFSAIENLYVADGHHRCKAASRAFNESENPSKDCAFFPAVLFPMSQMAIMAYNRIIFSLPTKTEEFLRALDEKFGLVDNAPPSPTQRQSISVYADGSWYGLHLPKSKKVSVSDQLDVALLGEHILEPMLEIQDPRTNQNIYFVGGIRGTKELERLVDSGKAELAISMYPTSIEELVDVSDAGELMPPKSTWFEPKLRSGLLVHLF